MRPAACVLIVIAVQTRADRQAADADANRWAEELQKAQGEVNKTRNGHDKVRRAIDHALAQVRQLEQEAHDLSGQVEQLQASLTPEAGSLLECKLPNGC